jgi:hypothetical protein
MAKPQKFEYLLEKSQQAAISAIEIYNKPDFKYREEAFCILMVNAWEILLKAKILKDNKNVLKSIYIPLKTVTKDKKITKRFYPKINRAGNPMTINIFNALKKLNIDSTLIQNIKLMVEIRDNSIHFVNKEKLLEKKILEIGIATLKSYIMICNQWFDIDFSRYNFYLMPLSFFHLSEIESFSVNKFDKQTKNLLNYIKTKERYYPSDDKKDHHISLILKTSFEKVPRIEKTSTMEFKITTDPNAPAFRVEQESTFKNKYTLDHSDLLKNCKLRYSNFSEGKRFNDVKKNILKPNKKYSDQWPANYKKPKLTDPYFYSLECYKILDNYYKKIND